MGNNRMRSNMDRAAEAKEYGATTGNDVRKSRITERSFIQERAVLCALVAHISYRAFCKRCKALL
jgi:hypothetical protein